MTIAPAPSGTQPLPAGTLAPDFDLPVTPGEAGARLRLSDVRGRPVVLAFYPFDWSPVCSDQLALYSEIYEEFDAYGARLFGISVDSRYSHAAFAEQRNLRVPLLADFEPKGEVSKRYGVYDEERGAAARALFVIDADGVIRWSYVAPRGINPGADGILQALAVITAAEAPR